MDVIIEAIKNPEAQTAVNGAVLGGYYRGCRMDIKDQSAIVIPTSTAVYPNALFLMPWQHACSGCGGSGIEPSAATTVITPCSECGGKGWVR